MRALLLPAQLMSVADENADGLVDYSEFVPIALGVLEASASWANPSVSMRATSRRVAAAPCSLCKEEVRPRARGAGCRG